MLELQGREERGGGHSQVLRWIQMSKEWVPEPPVSPTLLSKPRRGLPSSAAPVLGSQALGQELPRPQQHPQLLS